MTTPADAWPDLSGTDLVLGSIGEAYPDLLWLVPKSAAAQLHGARQALEATTWGALSDALHAVDEATAAWFLEDLEDEHDPDDPFVADDISGVADGDTPPHPGALTATWLPKAILDEYGRTEETVLNGTFWGFDASDETALIAALEQAGYTCRRDDNLMTAATGF